MALVEPMRDLLRQLLDIPLLRLLRLLIVEARQHVLLVQTIQLLAFLRDVGQEVGDVVANVRPPRGQEVHFYDGVAIVLERSRGEQAPAVFGGRACAGEVVGEGIVACESGPVLYALLRVVRVGLAVGYVAGCSG